MLEDGNLVAILGPSVKDTDGVSVHIGDHDSNIMRDYSVVLTAYNSSDGGGFLGVLGPNECRIEGPSGQSGKSPKPSPELLRQPRAKRGSKFARSQIPRVVLEKESFSRGRVGNPK